MFNVLPVSSVRITTVPLGTLLQKAGEGSLMYVGATVHPSQRLSAHRRRFVGMGEMLVTPVANMRQVEDQLLQFAATTRVENRQHKSNARDLPGYVYGIIRDNATDFFSFMSSMNHSNGRRRARNNGRRTARSNEHDPAMLGIAILFLLICALVVGLVCGVVYLVYWIIVRIMSKLQQRRSEASAY